MDRGSKPLKLSKPVKPSKPYLVESNTILNNFPSLRQLDRSPKHSELFKHFQVSKPSLGITKNILNKLPKDSYRAGVPNPSNLLNTPNPLEI